MNKFRVSISVFFLTFSGFFYAAEEIYENYLVQPISLPEMNKLKTASIGKEIFFHSSGYFADCLRINKDFLADGFRWKTQINSGLYCMSDSLEGLWSRVPPEPFVWYKGFPVSDSFELKKVGDLYKASYYLAGFREVGINNIGKDSVVKAPPAFFTIPEGLKIKITYESKEGTIFKFKIEESLDGGSDSSIQYITLNIRENDLISHKGIEIEVSKSDEENGAVTYDISKEKQDTCKKVNGNISKREENSYITFKSEKKIKIEDDIYKCNVESKNTYITFEKENIYEQFAR